MKESELRKHAVCSKCEEKILACGVPLFYRVTIERFGVEIRAVERQEGLTMLLGGSVSLANIMGPNEDMATAVMDKRSLTICEKCSTENTCVSELAEGE